MISYPIYKVMHLLGILMIFLSLGGLMTHVANGGTKKHRWRKPIAITHGIGMLLTLVGGFGVLARLGIVHGGLPGWVIVKLLIWVTLGGLLALIYRKAECMKYLWWTPLVLGATAAYLAIQKPF